MTAKGPSEKDDPAPSEGSRPAKSSVIYDLESVVERLDVNRIFPRAQPLELELGSGDGSFLVQYARNHPEINFIGVERLLGRLRKIDRKARRAGLENLRAIRIECAYLLQYLIPARCLRAIHVYFPDPWPKRRHRHHRLVNEIFPELCAAALEPDGCVFLRTDDRDYFEQMQGVFSRAAGFEPATSPAELCEVRTDFEREFHARGVPTLKAAYRKL